MELNREGNSLESFPESHPALPPEMATTACRPAGLTSTALQPRPRDPVTASRAEAGAGVPGHWACGRGCPARPPARLALEPGRELSKAVEREVAPAGKQTERLLDFLTGPAACQGRRASPERLPGLACAIGLPPRVSFPGWPSRYRATRVPEGVCLSHPPPSRPLWGVSTSEHTGPFGKTGGLLGVQDVSFQRSQRNSNQKEVIGRQE